MRQHIFRSLLPGIFIGVFLSFFMFIPSALTASPQTENTLNFFSPVFSNPQPYPLLAPTFESSNIPGSFSGGRINPIDPDPSPIPTAKPIPPQIKQLPSPTTQDLTQMFEQYGKEFGVDPNKLARIAHCESTYNPRAVNGPYGGMYQFHSNTWMNDRKKRGWDPDPNLRFDIGESIRTAAAKISAGGINAWPVCGYK